MRHPPQPLNPEQRRRVFSLLALGATRRMACKFAGCRVLDLLAEIKRDPDFKRQVQEHELRPEIEALRSLLGAARDPKQWRAAAWALERFYPRRYASRKADTLRPGDLRATRSQMDQQLTRAIPDPAQRAQLLEELLKHSAWQQKPRRRKRRRTQPQGSDPV